MYPPSLSGGQKRTLSALFILVLIGLPVAGRTALPTYAARTPVHGVVNGMVRAQIARLARARASGLRAQQQTSIPVVITSSSDVAPAIRAAGGTVEADIRGKVTAARMPAGKIEGLARQPGVRTIFPSLKYHLDLDQSIPDIRANQVWAETDRSGIPIQGKGVLVGLVDSGVDYRNPDFVNPDGTSRIVSIWDQTTPGAPPAGYDYGTECDQTSIQSGSCPERDTDGHGTHVAGIALGNGRSGGSPPEIGVAPQANLIVVKSDLTLDHILAAWKYLTDRAKALHRPIVINNSFGSSISPHDGSSPDSLAVDQLSGPGRIFVAAAGNEGDQQLHTSGVLSSGATSTVNWTATGYEDTVSVGLFYRSDSKLDFRLTGTGDSFHVSEGGSIEDQSADGGRLRVTMESDTWDDKWSILYVSIKAADTVTGSFQLQMSPLTVGSNPRYDAWIAEDDGAHFDRPDESDTVGSPADGHSVIAVGNYATRTSWTDHDGQTYNICTFAPCTNDTLAVGDITAYSSIGPTIDGRHKPDISAPGTMIVSSLSRDVTVCAAHSAADCVSPKLISQDGLHMVETGTSMSSPHVAGTVALMLQVDPTLDPAQTLSMLQASARHDQFTGPGWSPTFGAGKLDAFGAVRLALQAPPATPTATRVPPTAVPTSTPTAIPTPTTIQPEFSLVAIRVDRLGRSDGWRVLGPNPRVRTGTGVDLSVYTRFNHLRPHTSVTVTWRVYRAGASAFGQAHSYSLNSLDTGMTWRHVRFTPRLTGVYTFVARVALGHQSATKTATFTVVKA